MTTFTWIWLGLAVAGVVTEIVALVAGGRVATLSTNIWVWLFGQGIKNYPMWLAILNRVILGGFLVYLFLHLEFHLFA